LLPDLVTFNGVSSILSTCVFGFRPYGDFLSSLIPEDSAVTSGPGRTRIRKLFSSKKSPHECTEVQN